MAEGDFGYSTKLPKDNAIREIFQHLCQDVGFLHDSWTFYLELFSKTENVTLLSDMVRGSFQVIEEAVRRDMTMAICRLADPAQTFADKDKQNCSLETLIGRCDPIQEVKGLLAEFQKIVAPIKKYRDKRIAHNDLAAALRPQENPLPDISRSDVDKALQLASRILNAVGQRYAPDNQWSFRSVPFGGADTLMHWLREAWKQYQEELRQLQGPS